MHSNDSNLGVTSSIAHDDASQYIGMVGKSAYGLLFMFFKLMYRWKKTASLWLAVVGLVWVSVLRSVVIM
jgi:hypothetical protein